MCMKSFTLGFKKSVKMGKKFSKRLKENDLVLKRAKNQDPS